VGLHQVKILRTIYWFLNGGIRQLKSERDRLARQLKQYEERPAGEALAQECAGLYFNFANLLVEKGRMEEALAAYQKAETLGFKNWILHHYWGNLLHGQGKLPEAVAQWEKAVAFEPVETLEMLSDIIVRIAVIGDDRLAAKWLQKAEFYYRKTAVVTTAERTRYLLADYISVLGHTCLLDYYFKGKQLGLMEVSPTCVLAPESSVANASLLDYFLPYLRWVKDKEEIKALHVIAQQQRDCKGFTVFKDRSRDFWESWAYVQTEWEKQGRLPLIKLNPAHAEKGWQCLQENFGLTSGDWFVCLHVREPGFHGDHQGLYQTTRNASIETYRAAVKEVVGRGGKVIRMGDASMQPFVEEGCFDYARSGLKSDWMDVFLGAACRVFVGTESGLGHLPPLFGVPCALTNWNTYGVRSAYGADRYIPKLIWHQEKKRHLTFAEAMSPPMNHFQYQLYFTQAGCEVIDNEDADIVDLVVEVLEELASGGDRPLSLPQEQFSRLALEKKCHGQALVGKRFLEKYPELLAEAKHAGVA
jgi:putative glycosyltransferase (TIGR04372 family)